MSYAWTRAHATPETKGFLAGLPFRLDLLPLGGHQAGPRVVLVHGAPTLNTLYWTEDRSDDFCLRMAAQAGLRAGDVICCGHTHKPWHRSIAPQGAEARAPISDAARGIHFVNTGSVGRPKDGDWRAGYVVLDVGLTQVAIEFRRVEYDLSRAMDGIRASELPDAFAEHLRTGGQPVAQPAAQPA